MVFPKTFSHLIELLQLNIEFFPEIINIKEPVMIWVFDQNRVGFKIKFNQNAPLMHAFSTNLDNERYKILPV